MRRAYAIRHVSFEDAGILTPLLARHGIELVEVNAWAIPAEAAEAPLVVFLGGPISVNDEATYPFLTQELALARTRLAADLPTLGICLGAQMLCRAAGGTVGPGPQVEIGWAPVTLTPAGAGTPLALLQGVPVLHWHGERCHLPAGIEPLAATALCPVQAFRPAPKSLALQFHPEARGGGMEAWFVGYTTDIAALPGITVADLRAETGRNAAAARAAAETMFTGWLAGVGLIPAQSGSYRRFHS